MTECERILETFSGFELERLVEQGGLLSPALAERLRQWQRAESVKAKRLRPAVEAEGMAAARRNQARHWSGGREIR